MRALLIVALLGCGDKKQAPPPPLPTPAPPGLQPPPTAPPRDALPAACNSGECISACRAGDDAACRGYARAVRDDHDADRVAAAEVADAACTAKSPAGCELAADLRADDEMAYLEKSCALDGWSACWRIANRASDGRDLPKDEKRALELWQRACDGGFHPACATLGLHQALAGRPAEAVAAYDKACAGNHEGACYELGILLADGRGTAANRDRALALLEAECTKWGYTQACDAHREVAARLYPLQQIQYRSFPIEYAGATFSRSKRSKAEAKQRADAAVRALASSSIEDVATKYGDREASEETTLFRHTRDPYGDAAAFAVEAKLFALPPGGALAEDATAIGYVVHVRTGSK